MGGTGYNPSLAAGRSARGKAGRRTPVHFYIDVPLYVVTLPCVDKVTGVAHTFRSRTPLAYSTDGQYPLWCVRCRETRWVRAITAKIESPRGADMQTADEQDKGILRERAALWLGQNLHLDQESMLTEAAIRFGRSHAELRRIAAGLALADNAAERAPRCAKGAHLMTPDNIQVDTTGRRRCRACRLESKRAYRRRK